MDLLNWTLVVLATLVAVLTAGHALLYKRDPRAALGWVAVSLMFPVAGPFLYFLFGVNRIRTRAQALKRHSPFRLDLLYERPGEATASAVSDLEVPRELSEQARISSAVTGKPLVSGNRIEPLHNGEQAYPAMLEAIDAASRYLYLTTYIFETNETGRRFIDRLGRARKRGVDVRVILDGVGELYSLPPASRLLQKIGVPVVRFLPPKLFPPTVHINLRNHRKILVADGRVGFTGGMNIGDRHLAADLDNASRVVDMHFRLTGPVVTQMEQVFLEDWSFLTGALMSPSTYSGPDGGQAICRSISDGPNEDMDKLATILVGAVAAAHRRVAIMTPYFLPPRELVAGLQAAALRGVEVIVILPSRNNLPYVHWATRNMLWELLQRGVRVFYQPPPFVHSKLFLVDDQYAQIGSANIDSRSLRLNFELAIEVYDKPFGRRLAEHVAQVQARSEEVSLKELDTRPLPIRVRDALAWLFSPYL